METKNLIVFDFETTGLDPQNDQIIEIGAEKILPNGQVVEEFHSIIKPTIPVNPGAEMVHGITQDIIEEQGQPAEKILPAFQQFYGNDILVGHNILGFDLKFLRSHLLTHNLPPLNNQYLDTLIMARQIITGLPNYKLGTLANFFRIDNSGAHRALKDVQMNRLVFLKLLEIIQNNGSSEA